MTKVQLTVVLVPIHKVLKSRKLDIQYDHHNSKKISFWHTSSNQVFYLVEGLLLHIATACDVYVKKDLSLTKMTTILCDVIFSHNFHG